MWWSWGHAPGWWFVMPVLMVAFWVGVFWLAARLVRAPLDEETAPRGPEQILAERYARGELDDDEYRRRLDVLRRAAPAGSQR